MGLLMIIMIMIIIVFILYRYGCRIFCCNSFFMILFVKITVLLLLIIFFYELRVKKACSTKQNDQNYDLIQIRKHNYISELDKTNWIEFGELKWALLGSADRGTLS